MSGAPSPSATGPARGRRRRSLVDAWREGTPHPVVTLAVVAALEVGATAGLIHWAGWESVTHALARENLLWFLVCAGGQVVAYSGYALALRALAAVDGGVELSLPASLAVVSVGFGPMFSATASGGFSVDYATLREAGLSDRRAFHRVLGLSALEYAVLAPAVAACGALLMLGIGGTAPASVALPWLAVVPGVLIAAWLTSPARGQRFAPREGQGRTRRGLGHLVAALRLLRGMVTGGCRQWLGPAGAALYWIGDIVTLWAALRVFGVQLSVPVLVLAYGTGWALTRRSLPFGGPGVVEVLLAWVLTWFHVDFGSAAAGVVAYRLFNLWLALLPALAVLPFGRRLEREVTGAARP